MNILILLKSNNNIVTLEDCKTRSEFFAYMIKSLLPDYATAIIKNCNQNIKNISSRVDYIIYINDTGFYYENQNFIKNIKQLNNQPFKYIISSFGISNKFYTNEDVMFGLTKNDSNDKYIYIPPPVNEDLYTLRDTDYFCILFDNTQKIYDTLMVSICDIMKKVDDNNNIIICTINASVINYYDLELNLIETIYFDSYLDYINELSKVNLYVLTNTCSDTYKLYELSMCNIPILSHASLVPKNIVDELEIYTYSQINEIDWPTILNKSEAFNVREKLIMNNYSWTNAITIIINEFNKRSDNFLEIKIPVGDTSKTKTLNIVNLNKPNITDKKVIVDDINVTDKIYEILDLPVPEKPKPKRRILLQSQILRM